MHRSQSNGRLSLPNSWCYYLATRFSQLAQWFAPTSQVPCLYFEEHSILPFHLQGLLWSKSIKPREIYPLNMVVAQSYHLWHRFKYKFHLVSSTPPGFFLCDPHFSPAFRNCIDYRNTFSILVMEVMQSHYFNYLFSDNKFRSFHDLHKIHNLPLSELPQYTQIEKFKIVNKYYSLTLQTPYRFAQIESISSPRDREFISRIYRCLNETSLPEKWKPMLQWEIDLDQSFSLSDWNTMIQNLLKCTRSILVRETAIKLHTRWYLTPYRIN